MKHKIKANRLKRDSAHRKAMLSNMATSLLKHERIITTKAKAKELRRYVEPIITKAKVVNLHNKRQILSKIKDRKVVVKLFENIGFRYAKRPGGYTRIIRLSKSRAGDDSKMAIIELVEEHLSPKTKKTKPKKTLATKEISQKTKEITKETKDTKDSPTNKPLETGQDKTTKESKQKKSNLKQGKNDKEKQDKPKAKQDKNTSSE